MKTEQEMNAIISRLKALYPDAMCSLDYEKDYEIPDVILDVFDEFTLFKGLNELKYAKIYYKSDDGEYKLF